MSRESMTRRGYVKIESFFTADDHAMIQLASEATGKPKAEFMRTAAINAARAILDAAGPAVVSESVVVDDGQNCGTELASVPDEKH